MNRWLLLISICVLLCCSESIAQDRAVPATLIQLIANPDQFDGKLIAVRGYLVMVGGHHDVSATFLNVSREDADNMLGNAIAVVASDVRNPSDWVR
jgi:hypothetical protein